MYEYAVLEYAFSFWQWQNATCQDIPSGSEPDSVLFRHLTRVIPFSMYSDRGVAYYAPFMYQAYTELGYYCYDITDFRGLLKAVKNPSNDIFAPDGPNLKFNCATMHAIYDWLQNRGDRIIYVYGGNDAWSATSMQLNGTTDALKLVKKGGSHRTRIRNLPVEYQELARRKLEEWLGVSIEDWTE